VSHSGDLNSYTEIIDGGLLTGEACYTGNIMLNIGHGMLQTGQIFGQSEMLETNSMEWANIIFLSEFP